MLSTARFATRVVNNGFLSNRAIVGAGVFSTMVLMNQSRTLCSSKIEANLTKPILYQYLTCPFCNRVKSYLDYCGIDYDIVEVNPLTKSEIGALKDVKTKKVPIAVLNGQSVEDSKAIIDAIIKASKEERSASYPGDNFFPDDSEKWMEWSEKKLAVMLYPNITRSWEESWECFGYAENVPTWNWFTQKSVRVAGTAAMTFANGKIKKKYGIENEREALKSVIDEWIAAVGDKKFLHGDNPTMPDVIVYGVFRSIEGLKTFNEVMESNTALRQWYGNVQTIVVGRAHKVKTSA